MASLPSISLLLLLFTFSLQTHLTLSLPNNPSSSITDVHNLIPLYGLPKGLLPGNVKSYTLQNDTRSFTIHLTSPYYVNFNPLIYYAKNITGKLSYGVVSDVSRIQSKKLFIWLSVIGMEKVTCSEVIKFFVGSLFEVMAAVVAYVDAIYQAFDLILLLELVEADNTTIGRVNKVRELGDEDNFMYEESGMKREEAMEGGKSDQVMLLGWCSRKVVLEIRKMKRRGMSFVEE